MWEVRSDGSVGNRFKGMNAYVWPVRTGKPGTISLPKTGQVSCYDNAGAAITCKNTGQDGDLQKGVTWSSPRFTDNGDLTFTDNLTGLMWTRAGFAPGPSVCIRDGIKNWQQALDYAACLNTNNYLGHNDWRLPNINELESLVHAGEANTDSWLYTQGFTNVKGPSWSSTTYANSKSRAWVVSMYTGSVETEDKAMQIYVWPVRSAE